MASRVKSSWVGPRPPVVKTRSARCKARANPSVSMARLSPMMETPCSSIPSAGSRAAIKAEFVSVSSPMSNSVPMEKISAFTRILPGCYSAGDSNIPTTRRVSSLPSVPRVPRCVKRASQAHAAPRSTALSLASCLSTCLCLVSVLCSAISRKVHSAGYDSILRTEGGVVMDFYDVLERVLEILQQHKRVTYRALQRQFDLDEAYLEDLKAEIIEARQLAVDEGGRVLVWTGAAGTAPASAVPLPQIALQPSVLQAAHPHDAPSPTSGGTSEAERRQLTVLFGDLVDSTALARQLDPEDYREVVRAYQATCADVIQRFDGYIAQYLGDGLLVYFGYPQAHEDNAQRAVRAGLEMLDTLGALQARLAAAKGIWLAVRLGVHTGLVVVGAMGAGGRQEALALGDTPNIAARLQGLAAPDTVVVSDTTWRLVQGYFAGHDLGPQTLKGVETPVPVYRVLGTSGAQSRLDIVSPRGLTPLVGREAEVALLRERWAQARDGLGQVVLLSGEAGIGKSRLVQVLYEHVAAEPHARLEWRCSPYAQQSPLHPVIAHLHRLLRWRPDDTPAEKLHTLEE